MASSPSLPYPQQYFNLGRKVAEASAGDAGPSASWDASAAYPASGSSDLLVDLLVAWEVCGAWAASVASAFARERRVLDS